MTDESDVLAFACPHCGGPLHVVDNVDVECERKHRFTIGEVLLEQARTSSQATWLAVKALIERAETSRWAARDYQFFGLGNAETLEATAAVDDQTAEVLQKQAEALDQTIWRISQATPEQDGTPLK